MEISSHPAWVCGLKLGKNLFLTNDKRSHPAWVCGLKHIEQGSTGWRNMSHPAWVCGLKHDEILKRFPEFKVTPCVGVWIETERALENEVIDRHTLRGCVD